MKFLLTTLIALAFSAPTFALDANGKIFYAIPGGEIVKREATLAHSVSEKGKHEVSLVFGSGEKASVNEAKKVVVQKNAGRTVVQMLFVLEKPETDGHKIALVLSGTYLQGTNGKLYYGDMYKRSMGPQNVATDSLMNEFNHCGKEGCSTEKEKECEGTCEKKCEGECGGECEGGCGGECEGGCGHKHPKKPQFRHAGGFGFKALN